MNVATALNRKYLLYTGVMLTSLCENNPCHIDVYILHSELTDKDIQRLKDCLDKYDVTIYLLYIEKDKFAGRMYTDKMWSIEAYYRLMLLDVLPPNVKRMFYFDVDIIVNKSLEAFYNMNFDGNDLIACEDDCGNCVPEHYGPMHRKIFGSEELHNHRYFNSGVLLMNIEQMRPSDAASVEVLFSDFAAFLSEPNDFIVGIFVSVLSFAEISCSNGY